METAQHVAGTVEEKAGEAKEQLAEASQKGKEKLPGNLSSPGAKTGIHAPNTPEHKVHSLACFIRHASNNLEGLSTSLAEAPQQLHNSGLRSGAE